MQAAAPFDLIVRLGLCQVVQVDQRLPQPVMWVEEDRVAFISAGLSHGCLEAAADELLSLALTSLAESSELS